MKSLAIGNSDFKKLIESKGYYVDKTKLVDELIKNNSEVYLFARPRRFGKTLNMSMLENFFEVTKKKSNKDLFKGLYIHKSKYKDLQNTVPVIFMSFKDLKQNTFESVFQQFKMLIEMVYESKRYILDSLTNEEKEYFLTIVGNKGTIDDYKMAIKRLSDYLYKYHKEKVIILIDEYDVPIQQGYLDNFYNPVVQFIRSVFSSALKDNTSLRFGVLSGVLRVSKESIFSDMNNLRVHGILNSNFGEYFGFLEEETKALLEYYGLELSEEVKRMYDGYIFNDVGVYNPWSIINYASDKRLDTYWVNTSSNDLIKDLLQKTNKENKIKIEKLVQGEALAFVYNDKITYEDFEDYNNMNNILNLMFSSGYLTLDKTEVDVFNNVNTYIKIPNKEVERLINNIISNIPSKDSKMLERIKEFNQYLLENNKPKIEEIINDMLISVSYMDSQEYFYHAYLLGIFKSYLDSDLFIVKSNREAGIGRFDVMIEKVDKKIGFIIEFKLADKKEDMEELAKRAIKQMKEKEYYQELVLNKVEKIYEVAMVFKDKKCIVR